MYTKQIQETSTIAGLSNESENNTFHWLKTKTKVKRGSFLFTARDAIPHTSGSLLSKHRVVIVLSKQFFSSKFARYFLN
jgi:hypothetical protein